MKKHMNKIHLIALIVAGSMSAIAQSPCQGVAMPPGTLCITQEAGNAAAQLAREAAAKDAKIKVLEDALIEKDKIIDSNKAVAASNEAELRAALHKTEVSLAEKTGSLIKAEEQATRMTMWVDTLIKHTRKKCLPLSVCF